jgi:peptidoglycan/LPS O-acetylase OafA/YrhL
MYLTHFAILTYFHRLGFSDIFPKSNLASLLHFLSVVIATAFAAFFFWKFVEKPGVALGRRLIEKLEQGQEESVKRDQCGLAMSRRLVGENPTWVIASHEPSIEPGGANGKGCVEA